MDTKLNKSQKCALAKQANGVLGCIMKRAISSSKEVILPICQHW